VPAYLHQGWLHAKFALVAALIFYHGYLTRLTHQFARGEVTHSSRWLRIFNEIPAVLLIGIAILAVVKPF
jgi:putative membrane protein